MSNQKIKINSEISIHLDKLVESRLLVQANSGGGKSWAIRRIIEQAFGKVQIIVLDPEGEFTNLREKYDFVFAGKDGDAPVESRSAALLARRLLELKASAIVDLYELPPQERKHFVRLFCEAMVNAPKELWHDCLVIIDEAHVFAPEKGESEAMGPVIDLATRGRKRGYCVVLATQRLPKLNKDAAAECNNKLIGRASQDIDRKRAAEELGFTTKEQTLSLRDLEPGEFYAFGPAISRDVIKTKIGDVNVKPPPRGVARHVPPPPTEKIKRILSQLADLPQEAQKEAQSLVELKQQVKTLTHQLRSRPVEKVEQVMGVSQWMKYGEKYGYATFFESRIMQKAGLEWEKIVKSWEEYAKRLRKVIAETMAEGDKANNIPAPAVLPSNWLTPSNLEDVRLIKPTIQQTSVKKKEVYNKEVRPSERVWTGPDDQSITGPEQRVLDAIAWCESIGMQKPPHELVAFLSGYSHFRSTGYTNPRGYLKTKGLVDYGAGSVFFTDAGRAIANIPQTPLTQEELHRVVLDKLTGPEQRLLKPLLDAYPQSISNEALCAAAGYTHERSTGYTNPRGYLKSKGLVIYEGGEVKAASLLFLQ